MATPPLSRVVGHLRRVTLVQAADRLTDAQLVESFLAHPEGAAFEALVRRHGPMVLGVCNRVLHGCHDAEDAFQATFLCFILKARNIRKRQSLASWLYGIARRTALEARKKAVQRRAKERQVQEMAQRRVAEDNALQDLLPHLDQEVSRLPNKYRVPIILCDLEGKTRKAAAHQLDLPEKTLSTRLDRARAMLAKRLARHGAMLSGSALALALSQGLASGSVSQSLVASTVKIGSLVAAGQTGPAAAISAKVAVLSAGVVKTMLLTKLKTMAIVLAVVTILGSGVGTLGRMALAEKRLETKQAGEKPADKAKETTPDEPQAKRQGVEKPGRDDPFASAPGYTWFQRPEKLDHPWTPGSINGMHFAGGSLTITQMQDGSLLFVLVGASPTVKTNTNYRPVVFDREKNRYVAQGNGGGASPNAGMGLFTSYYLLSAKDLPAEKVAYLGIEAETIVAKEFEDFTQLSFGQGNAQATGTRDKGGFTVIPMEAPKGRTKICLSFAVKEDQSRSANFRVLAVDAGGKRHEALVINAVSAGGNGTAVITMVLEFNLSSDSLRTLVVQRAKSSVQSR